MISDKRHKALQDYVFQFSGAVRFITDIVNAFALGFVAEPLIFVVKLYFSTSDLGYYRQNCLPTFLLRNSALPYFPLSAIKVTFAFIVPM